MTLLRALSCLSLAALGFMLAGPAGAAPTPGIDRRERQIERRIERGIRSGALTRGEARRLHRGLGRLRVHESRLKSDGCLSHPERRRLQHHSRCLSREVTRLNHNRRWAF